MKILIIIIMLSLILTGPAVADTASNLNNVGIRYGRAGQYEKAIECFDKALKKSANAQRLYKQSLSI